MSAGRAGLAGVVPPAAAFPEQHQAVVFGAFGVGRRDWVPAAAVRTVQFVTGTERWILSREIAQPHHSIMPHCPDGIGPPSVYSGSCLNVRMRSQRPGDKAVIAKGGFKEA